MGSCNSSVYNAGTASPQGKTVTATPTQNAWAQVSYSKLAKNSPSKGELKRPLQDRRLTVKKQYQTPENLEEPEIDESKEQREYVLYRAFTKKRKPASKSVIEAANKTGIRQGERRNPSLEKMKIGGKSYQSNLPSIIEEGRRRRIHQRLPSSGSMLDNSCLSHFYQEVSAIDRLYGDPLKMKRSVSANTANETDKPFVKKLVFCGGMNNSDSEKLDNSDSERRKAIKNNLPIPKPIARMSPRRGHLLSKLEENSNSKRKFKKFVLKDSKDVNQFSIEKSIISSDNNDNDSPKTSQFTTPPFSQQQRLLCKNAKSAKSIKPRDRCFPLVIKSSTKKETDYEKFVKGVHVKSRLPHKPIAAIFINDAFMAAKY